MSQLIFEHWAVVFLLMAVAITWLSAKLLLADDRLPYQKRPSLLTDSELAFYRVLHEAVDGQWAIHTMVRLADLIQVRPQTPKSQTWQSRLQARHVDFLLCDRSTLEAKLALELDDAQPPPDRQARNQFVTRALADAGLPLMRIDAGPSYDAGQLRKSIDERLGIKANK